MTRSLFYSMIAFSAVTTMVLFSIAVLGFFQDEVKSESSRVVATELGHFTESIELDFPRALETSAKRALVAANNRVIESGTPLVNAQDSLYELSLNGTLFGAPDPILTGSSLNYWINATTYLAEQQGISTNLTLESISFRQQSPFVVEIVGVISLNASIPRGSYNIYRLYNATATMNLSDVEDPLYPLKTNGFVQRLIMPAEGVVYNVTLLDQAVANKWYIPSSSGATWLDRLEGRIENSGAYAPLNSSFGLESFIYAPDFEYEGILEANKSMLDYVYFNATFTEGFNVTNSSLIWLRLDADTKSRYGVS